MARLKSTARKQIANISALAEDSHPCDSLRLFCDADQATETSPNTKVISVIQMAVSRSVAKSFQFVALQTTVEQDVHSSLAEAHILDAVKTRMIGASAFTVSVSRTMKHEVEKGSLEKAKLEKSVSG